MAAQNRRPNANRRTAKVNPAKKYALQVFVFTSVLVGLLVFGIFSIFQGEDTSVTDSTEPSEQSVIATAPDGVTPAPTLPNDSYEPDSEVDDEPYSDDDSGKIAASSVTYAAEDLTTVTLEKSDDHDYNDHDAGTVYCESVILIDISENTVVASKSSDKRIYPASLTKVMTLITAYDYIDDPYTEHFTMTQEILEPLITSGNSLAGFEVGESSPLIDYMYGMIMFSGADATEAIATHCSGSVEAFVDAMNRKAKEIGLKNTHFTNPVGTHDDDHYSTVHDMALILGYAYETDILAEILSTYKYTTAPTDKHPDGLYFESNLQQRMKGDESGTCEVLGGKTGFTNDAGNCVVAYARSNKTGKYYLFAAAGGDRMYDPIWDCINTLKDYVE